MKQVLSKTLLSLTLLLAIHPAQADFRILAFGDSNTWGWRPDGSGLRFNDAERWTGILQAELGDGFTVITDGLVARRTNVDGLDVPSIDGYFLNAAKTLPPSIIRNAPIDLVIIFLGTNDLQRGIERSAEAVAEAVAELCQQVTQSKNLLYSAYPAPSAVWVVVPPELGDLSQSPLKGLFQVGQDASRELGAAFDAVAAREKLTVFHLETIAPKGVGGDGIHLSASAHEALGMALAAAVTQHIEPTMPTPASNH